MKYPFIVALAVLTLPAVAQEAPDSFRCGTDLVETGSTEYEVLSQCGRPDAINRDPLEEEERWIYDRGVGRFLIILTFQDDVLRFIELGERQ